MDRDSVALEHGEYATEHWHWRRCDRGAHSRVKDYAEDDEENRGRRGLEGVLLPLLHLLAGCANREGTNTLETAALFSPAKRADVIPYSTTCVDFPMRARDGP